MTSERTSREFDPYSNFEDRQKIISDLQEGISKISYKGKQYTYMGVFDPYYIHWVRLQDAKGRIRAFSFPEVFNIKESTRKELKWRLTVGPRLEPPLGWYPPKRPAYLDHPGINTIEKESGRWLGNEGSFEDFTKQLRAGEALLVSCQMPDNAQICKEKDVFNSYVEYLLELQRRSGYPQGWESPLAFWAIPDPDAVDPHSSQEEQE